jgi:hypothetical protein
MPAKLPQQLIRKRPPKVADLEPGSEAFVSVYAIKVDLDRSVYVLSDIAMRPAGEKCVRISRDKQGAYHLDLDGIDDQFEAKDLKLEKKFGLLVPIESVSGFAEK